MTDDIVARLRALSKMWGVDHVFNYYDAAADEIERLRARLRLCAQVIETQDGLKAEIVRKDAALQKIALEHHMFQRAHQIAFDALAGEKTDD